jgi:hypothetical protein
MHTRRSLSHALWIGKRTHDGEVHTACDTHADGAGAATSQVVHTAMCFGLLGQPSIKPSYHAEQKATMQQYWL